MWRTRAPNEDPRKYTYLYHKLLLQKWIDREKPMMRVGTFETKDIKKVAEIMGLTKDDVQKQDQPGIFAIDVEARRGVDARNKAIFSKEEEDGGEEEPAMTKPKAATLAGIFEDALSSEDHHRLLSSVRSCKGEEMDS